MKFSHSSRDVTTAYRQDTLSSIFIAGRTAAPGWKPGTGGFT